MQSQDRYRDAIWPEPQEYALVHGVSATIVVTRQEDVPGLE